MSKLTKSTTDKNLLREIAIVLIVKLILLFAIWYQFFYDDKQKITTDDITKIILSEQQGEHL